MSIRRFTLMPPVLEGDTNRAGTLQLAEFSISSEPGNERMAMEHVAQIVSAAGFPPDAWTA